MCSGQFAVAVGCDVDLCEAAGLLKIFADQGGLLQPHSVYYFAMSDNASRRIGGEYGAVRAAFDVEKLNTYLKTHVPPVTPPVIVKQFKVCPFPQCMYNV